MCRFCYFSTYSVSLTTLYYESQEGNKGRGIEGNGQKHVPEISDNIRESGGSRESLIHSNKQHG